ncbi:hypothetical protein D3C77_695980 [compost metagenome]
MAFCAFMKVAGAGKVPGICFSRMGATLRIRSVVQEVYSKACTIRSPKCIPDYRGQNSS